MVRLYRTRGVLLALLVFALFAVVPANWRGGVIRVVVLAVVVGLVIWWDPYVIKTVLGLYEPMQAPQ